MPSAETDRRDRAERNRMVDQDLARAGQAATGSATAPTSSWSPATGSAARTPPAPSPGVAGEHARYRR
jgi:hypothetical protein